jgi:hypothetical protein
LSRNTCTFALVVTGERDDDRVSAHGDREIEKQVDLVAARNVKQLPFVPVRSINLMGDEDSGVEEEQRRELEESSMLEDLRVAR